MMNKQNDDVLAEGRMKWNILDLGHNWINSGHKPIVLQLFTKYKWAKVDNIFYIIASLLV